MVLWVIWNRLIGLFSYFIVNFSTALIVTMSAFVIFSGTPQTHFWNNILIENWLFDSPYIICHILHNSIDWPSINDWQRKNKHDISISCHGLFEAINLIDLIRTKSNCWIFTLQRWKHLLEKCVSYNCWGIVSKKTVHFY